MAGRKSVAQFFDHDTNTWFSPGDEVPTEVADRLADNPLLFEEQDEADTKADAPRRSTKAAEK